MLFEPGENYKIEGHDRDNGAVSGSESDSPAASGGVEQDCKAFDLVSKRDFMIRRGRNNQILMRSIMRNVFDEKQEKNSNFIA